MGILIKLPVELLKQLNRLRFNTKLIVDYTKNALDFSKAFFIANNFGIIKFLYYLSDSNINEC